MKRLATLSKGAMEQIHAGTLLDRTNRRLRQMETAIRENLMSVDGAMARCRACHTSMKKIDFQHADECWVGELGLSPVESLTVQ